MNVILLYISPKEVASAVTDGEDKILPKLKETLSESTSLLNQTFHVGIGYNDLPCIVNQTSLEIIKY